MIGEAEVIVGAEIQYRCAVGDGNFGLLRAGDDALVFVEAGGLDFGDFVLQVLLESSVHWVPFRLLAAWGESPDRVKSIPQGLKPYSFYWLYRHD
jgi:hypothetical protein